jgi:hypothetical protein
MNSLSNENPDILNIIERHFSNINHLSEIIQESNTLIQTLLRSNIRNTSNMNTTNRTLYNTAPRTVFSRRNSPPSNFMNPNTANVSQSNSNIFYNNVNRNDELHDDNYVIRFETLLPLILDSFNVDNNTNMYNNINDISYNIGRIPQSQSQIDISMIETHDLLDIEHYSTVQQQSMNDICPITRERFFDNQTVMMICRCKHVFNKSSLNIWLRNNNTCPTCRVRINRRTTRNVESV